MHGEAEGRSRLRSSPQSQKARPGSDRGSIGATGLLRSSIVVLGRGCILTLPLGSGAVMSRRTR